MSLNHTSTNRVTALRENLNLSQQEFADKIGITQGALSQLEAGKSTLSLSTITKISQVFNVDCNWLILGIEGYDESNFQSYQKALETSFIPLVNEEAHAGYIEQCSDEGYIKTLDVYKIPGFENGNYRLFEVEGDSMMPIIRPRETLITEQVKDIKQLENGSVCVVVTKDGIVAKRLFSHNTDPISYLFKSDNPEYKTYSIQGSDILEIWRVKAKISSITDHDSQIQSQRFQSIENEIRQLKEHISRLLPPQS